MFYKITISVYPSLESFKKGQGFYWVKNTTNNSEDIHYWNPSNAFWLTLEPVTNYPESFLDLFEDSNKEIEAPLLDTPLEGYVSESFALKAMALAKANTQTIKIQDILK